MQLKVTNIFDRVQRLPDFVRLAVLEGGARSSKTWSLLQDQILYCLKRPGYKHRITISRSRLTWLRATVIPDFIEIMQLMGLWRSANFNKSDLIYRLHGNEICFIGLDEEQKLRGRKQHRFWINEANEAEYDSYKQLLMRTSGRGYLDYNPSMTEHWIFDKVIPRPDAAFIHSTLLDNPFLDPNIRKEILSFEPTPENIAAGTADRVSWEIYGLGKRAVPEGLVFPNWDTAPDFPPENTWKKWGYFMDYGFTNDPTAIGKVVLSGGRLYAKELVYKTGLVNITNPHAPHIRSIEQELNLLNVGGAEIVSESAEPKSNFELRNAGFNIRDAVKGPDSVRIGLDVLKRYPVYLVDPSVNAMKEKNNYKWKQDPKTLKWLNEPIDAWNHFIDGLRYWALIHLHKPMNDRSEKKSAKEKYGFY